MSTILERLRTSYGSMSPAYRRMAEYIAENYAEVAFMSASQVAAQCQTHESVVVKFAVSLGFSGYPEMLRDIQEATISSMEPPLSRKEGTDFHRFHSLLTSVESALRNARDREDLAQFARLVEAARAAPRVFIVGFHTDAATVHLTAFYLDLVGYRVTSITDSGAGLFERLRKVAMNDLVVAISLPPHLKRVREALEIAQRLGAVTAVFTDSPASPVAAAANLVIAANLADDRPVAQRTVLTSLINAWVTALALQDRERALASMEELDQLLLQAEIVIQ